LEELAPFSVHMNWECTLRFKNRFVTWNRLLSHH
jgi:hypothetical protein